MDAPQHQAHGKGSADTTEIRHGESGKPTPLLWWVVALHPGQSPMMWLLDMMCPAASCQAT